jgi:tetratricopeptide (TPR) repeat protein
LNEIGIQLFAQKKFAEALEVFHDAKIISTSRFGLTHPSLSMFLNNIGCCRFSQGNFNEAFNIFLKAIEIEKGTARDDLDVLHVGMTMSNLGYILIQMKQYEKAQEMFEEALLVS